MEDGHPVPPLSRSDSGSGTLPAEERGADHADPFEPTLQPALDYVEEQYGALLGRLARKLRSNDAAADALHDLYVKLRSGVVMGDVRSPAAYLYRAAVNIALNSRRKVGRTESYDAGQIDRWPDENPGPERIIAGRHEIELGIQSLDGVSVRQRDIFLAFWRDGKSQSEIATDFGLHKRTVQKALARAEVHVRRTLGRF